MPIKTENKDLIRIVVVTFIAAMIGNFSSSFFRFDAFTGKDAYELERRIDKRIDELPPKWLDEKVKDIQVQVNDLREELREHERGHP